jgi:branched-subunit amino acid aminotransferase/4-amino-4-deoxychorismate lyase
LNGLLQSRSQALATEAAKEVLDMPVSEGVFTLGSALRADEMFVMSSTRGGIRVESVGNVRMSMSCGVAKVCCIMQLKLLSVDGPSRYRLFSDLK